MIRKQNEKNKAVELRKLGKTYAEILTVIPVAKSTLAIWLHSVGLAKSEKQRFTEFKMITQKKGAESRRLKRIASTKVIHLDAEGDVTSLSKRDLWLMGIMLYWAEGSKQKPHNVAQPVHFSNSDTRMIQLFINWLVKCCEIPRDSIELEIYLHDTHKHRIQEVKKYWAKSLSFPTELFQKIYFKKGNPKTQRENIGENYFGLIRVRVPASTNFNRKIDGWVNGICKYWGIV